MKVTIRRSGGYVEGHITEARGEAYGIVELTDSPELDNDAATVAYVESRKNNTTVERYAIGELPVERLPAFVGEVVSVEGTGEVNLAPTGVSQGSSHIKVSVNSKGQITAGGSYSEADIPDLPFTSSQVFKYFVVLFCCSLRNYLCVIERWYEGDITSHT